MPSTCAIVVTYNSVGEIAACLTPLLAAGIDVVVVDNASEDGTAALIQREFPAVELIINLENRGFAAAVNQGLGVVTGDVVLLVNPDCVLPAVTAQVLAGHLNANPRVAIAAPRIVGPDRSPRVSAHPFESLTSVVVSRFGGAWVPLSWRRWLSGGSRKACYEAGAHGVAPVSVDWVSGACLAVSSRYLAQVGGLCEAYFMYYEDEELCWQAWQSHWRVDYLPFVEATHIGGASSCDPRQTWPHLYQSMLTFFGRVQPGSEHAVRRVVRARAVVGMGMAGARMTRNRTNGHQRYEAWRSVWHLAGPRASNMEEIR